MYNGKCYIGGYVGYKIVGILLIVGGLNWGLVGVGMLMGINLNVVNLLLGGIPMLEAVIYVLVGVAAILRIFCCQCQKCKEACANCCQAPNTGAQV